MIQTISLFLLGYFLIGLIVAMCYVLLFGDDFSEHLMNHTDAFKDDSEEQTLLSIFVVAVLAWPAFIQDFF